MSSTEEATRADGRDDEAAPLVARLALAALCAAAGAVHLAMVPGHSQESTLDGILFLVGGWAQVALAVALLAWPRRAVLQATVVVNLAAAVTWVVSRTAGLPFGADPGEKEPAATLDQMTTAFEVAAVVLAAVVLLRPALWQSLGERALLAGAVVPVVVVVATSVVLTSPEAANHHANDPAAPSAQLTAASQRCDLGLNPAAYWQEATTAGWDTVTGGAVTDASTSGAATPAAGGSHHGPAAAPAAAAPAAPAAPAVPTTPIPSLNAGRGSVEVDRLMALSTSSGEAAEARLVSALADVSDDAYEAWLQRLSTTTTHAGPQAWSAVTSQQTCADLTDEVEQARTVALDHPTPVEAEAAGYTQVTGYVPGIAAHYMNFSYLDDEFAIDEPEMLLYDGTGDDASIVGLSYYIVMGAPVEPTQGFVGDNDRYHVHEGLCVAGTLVVGDSTTTAEDCAARGGAKAGGANNWMSHAWVVPGCESPWGVFSGANPLLDPTLGESSGTDGGSCAGSGVRDRYDLSAGSRDNTPTPVNGSDVQVAAP